MTDRNKFNKEDFIKRTLWNMYCHKDDGYAIVTDSDIEGTVMTLQSLALRSSICFHTHPLTYEEYYIWAWQPIVNDTEWQKALINSYIEHKDKEPDFDIFNYCCDEVLQLKKEIEEDKANLTQQDFRDKYFWSRL